MKKFSSFLITIALIFSIPYLCKLLDDKPKNHKVNEMYTGNWYSKNYRKKTCNNQIVSHTENRNKRNFCNIRGSYLLIGSSGDVESKIENENGWSSSSIDGGWVRIEGDNLLISTMRLVDKYKITQHPHQEGENTVWNIENIKLYKNGFRLNGKLEHPENY